MRKKICRVLVQGFGERTTCIGGDFFTGENLPEGASMYFMAYIIHDWDDAECTTILKNVGSVMHEGSKMVLMDFVRPPPLPHFLPHKLKITLSNLGILIVALSASFAPPEVTLTLLLRLRAHTTEAGNLAAIRHICWVCKV